ncbi:hypothetical protein ACTS9C_05510 [Empedobacter brevis]
MVINKSNFKPLSIEDSIRYRRGHISASLTVVSFIEEGSHIVYSPSLEMSGYGDTEEEAKEMFSYSMEDYFKTLIKLSHKTIEAELRKYGFKQKKYKSKNYSKLYVDQDGVLQGLDQPSLVDLKIEKFEVA